MPDVLNRKNRGGSYDRSFPETAMRALRNPHVAPNPYIGHRVTLPGSDGRLACDCGASYPTATELEIHQGTYRHPRS